MTRTQLACLGALTSLLLTGTAYAEMRGSSEGVAEVTTRGVDIDPAKLDAAKPLAPPAIKDATSRAAPILDPAKVVESMAVVTRSADGKETTTPPSPEFADAIKKEMTTAPAASGEAALGPDDAGSTSRQVLGDDQRVQINDTKSFPFRVFGSLIMRIGNGEGTCTGTLIGPRTVLTAAHCLWSTDSNAWVDEVIFVPGRNGNQAPFGAYAAENYSILRGFQTNFNGNAGSNTPWDLGIVTLQQPIGDQLGYLGYGDFIRSGFSANIVGFPGDKPGTMWRASCEVPAEAVGADIVLHDCDTTPGSSGSTVYAKDANSGRRLVTAVHVLGTPQFNVGVRLSGANTQWIDSLWK